MALRTGYFFTVLLAAVTLVLTACRPNISWEGPKTYSLQTEQLQVDDLGIDDVVDILPPGTQSFTVTRAITNTSDRRVSAGYSITENIVLWVFQAAGGSAGWVPGDESTHTVYNATQTGPELAPGESAPISFSVVIPLTCGLYQETLTVDSDNIIAESDEQDNEASHFFFVPSTQHFNITVTPIQDSLGHDLGPTHTHDFVITAAGAPGWVFGHFSFVAQEGSKADTVPAPPTPFAGASQTIQMFVTPKTHDSVSGTITGKVTVISQDGCIVKQKTATAFVEHTQ